MFNSEHKSSLGKKCGAKYIHVRRESSKSTLSGKITSDKLVVSLFFKSSAFGSSLHTHMEANTSQLYLSHRIPDPHLLSLSCTERSIDPSLNVILLQALLTTLKLLDYSLDLLPPQSGEEINRG